MLNGKECGSFGSSGMIQPVARSTAARWQPSRTVSRVRTSPAAGAVMEQDLAEPVLAELGADLDGGQRGAFASRA